MSEISKKRLAAVGLAAALAVTAVVKRADICDGFNRAVDETAETAHRVTQQALHYASYRPENIPGGR